GTALVVLARLVAVLKLVEKNLADHKFLFLGAGEAAMYSLDGIVDSVSAVHPLAPLLALLKPNGKLVMVGLPENPLELPMFSLCTGRKMIAGSSIGGMKETQEIIDFATKHNVKPEIEVIAMDYVNTVMECLAKADVKYRFVIDI
ncbi:hypothetical protein HN51_058995, partial [Arachis hypogaea]